VSDIFAAPPSAPNRADGAWRFVLSRLAPAGKSDKLSIGLFHRVHANPDPLFPGDPDAKRFDELCGWLAAWYQVLLLDDAVHRLARGVLPARALAIRFDDGYADNHDLAVPILRKHGLCATFFIATGFLDGGRMWNDTAVEAVRQCGQASLALGDLGLAGVSHLDLSSITARRQSLDRLLNATKYLPPDEREAIVGRGATSAGAQLPTDLMMRVEQVRAMADAGMQIGANTVSHPILACLTDVDARREIAQSKIDLEAILGRPVTLFAYPNGKPGQDYLPRDAALARDLGFTAAVSTAYGAACHAEDRQFDLPRFTPWDRERWAFAARLARNLYTSTRTS
jgi:peptidoglycan/xylan/chitin deacetylase (PgdA/CDA1 family)